MEQVKGCYVSIPFGRKLNPVSGALVDYDQIYNEIIRPTVEHAGLTCSRADEFYGGTLVLKSIFSAVIGSELMIADVSAANPNVMYELGVRHATSARPTILLASSDAHVPYHLTSTYYLRYDLNPSGSVTGPAAANLMALLARAIDMSLRTPVAFSPIFELFPEMQPNVSAVLSGPVPKDTEGDASLGRKTRHSHVSAAEQAMHKTEADPAAMLAIIKGYREVSAWDDLVRFVDTLPENVRQLPEVVQTLALALNRRVRPGDRKRAEALLTQLIEQTGGDGETFGILGRIYKDCFRESGESSFWRKAYEAYRKGFEVEPDNYYPGLNAVSLLEERGTPDTKRELTQLLPRVKAALQQKLATKPPDYWDLATGTHLAIIDRDWREARTFADQMLKSSPSVWMVATTVNDLKAMRARIPKADRGKLDRLVHELEAEIKTREA